MRLEFKKLTHAVVSVVIYNKRFDLGFFDRDQIEELIVSLHKTIEDLEELKHTIDKPFIRKESINCNR